MIDNIIASSTNGQYSSFTDYAEALRGLAKEVDSPFARRSVSDTVEANINAMKKHIDRYNTLALRREYAVMKDAVKNYRTGGLDVLKTIDVTKVAPELETPLYAIISDIERTLADEDTTSAVRDLVKQLDGIVDNYGEIGTKVHSRYGRPFSSVQNQMQIEAMINAQRFEHMTPTQYLEGIANHYGVQFTPEQIDVMVKQSMDKFNDVETAGKYYVFKESSEMNLNGIMNNKSLDKLFSDEEALDKVATICGYDIVGSARFNKSAVSSVQNELLFSLRECTENGNYNYHMLMDTCSGNADTINKYYSAYKQCSKLADKDMVLERMSRELAQHANTVHCAAYGTDLLPEDQIVAHLKEAFGTAFELDNNSYCTFMPTRDSVYSAIASANTALLLSDREDAMALSAQLEQILQEGAYTTTNDQLGMILSNAQLDNVLRQLTNNADVHVDQLKEIFDAMIEGDFEKSIGLRTLIDTDDASKFVTRDMVNKAAGTGTALTQELADYVHDWNMLYDNINDNLFTPEQLDQIKKTILAQANNLTSPDELRYLDYIAHADINDTGRCTAMLIDAQQRLGIDVRTTCAALKLKDVNLGELYTAAIKDKYIYKGKKLDAIVDMSTNEQFVSYMAKADYMDNLDVVLRKNDNQYKTMSAMLDATTGSDEERALLAYRIGRMEETNKVYKEFNDTMKSIGTQREIDTLRKVEEGLWNENIKRVLNMSKDELDATLVRSASNGIVCDTTNPKIAQWVADREVEGYVITHTQVAGQSVSIVSLDFNALDDTRKEFLRTATFESSKVKNFNGLANRGNYDVKTLDMLQNAYNNNLKHLGDDWNRSTLGSQVSMKWHNELQAKLPIQCRLDGSFTNLHNNAYMCNMLVSPETARACGAYKGHLLGSWFYADVAGTMKSVDVDNFTNAIMSGSTKLTDIMASDRPNVTFVKMKEAGYHIIDMDDVAKLQSGEAVKTRVTDLTDLMEVRNELPGATVTNSNALGYLTILKEHPNAVVVDDSVFRYITNEVNTTNRAFNYLTSPKTLQKVMDISDQMRNVYIQGQLYLANIKGTGFRNIIDSNIKALNELGADGMPAYTENWVKMVDIQNNYVEKMARVVEETGVQGTDGIYKYLLKHPDENAEQLLKWHTVFTLTGTADDDIAKMTRIAKNNALLDNLSVQLKPEQKELITQAFDRARDSHILSRKRMTDTEKFNAVLKELNKIDDEVVMQNVDEIAKLYGQWIDGKAMNWADKLFEADNAFGTALNKINKTTFDNAEIRCRNAMLLTMMDNGQDAIYANTKVIKTQFDYGTQKGLVNSWDKVMPFSKYQFCNAAYWLDNTNYSAFATRNAQRLAQATGYYTDRDPEEYFKYQAAISYIKSHNNKTQDSTEATFLQSVNNVIENYKGVKGEYTQGGIELGDGHLLKIGNGMVDTYQWVGKILAAPAEIENGYVPTFLKDTIFSPIPTLGKAMTDLLGYIKNPYREDALKAFDKYAGKNYYDLLAMIPIFGNLANIAISVTKNLKANQTLLGLTMCSPAISKEFLTTLAGEAEAVGMSALYSIFGIENTKGNRKVFMPYTDADGNKVTWSKLTDEEKANYLFLPGISQDKEWVTTPSAVYGLYGRLAELGLNKNDIKMLTKCKYKNESLMYDSKGNMYVDTAALETTVLDMLEHGYTTYEIWKLLSYNDRWYDLNTHRIIGTPAELEHEALSKAFLEGYQIIPDYIKYQPDMYKEMMERYKALGMTTAEAWRVMATNPAYIDENGYFEYLNDRQVNDYNTWVKNDYFEGQQDDGFLQWYSQLPEYIKYEKGAYSRTLAYLKQMFTSDEAKQMIANGAYYTVDGRLIDCKGLSRTQTKASGAFQDEAGYWHKAGDFQYDGYWYHKGDNPYLGLGSFQNYWNTLPDYLRYTKGAWSQTNSVLKEAGIDYNTRMKAMQDGAYAVQVDPNSDYFKELLAKQNLVSITKTVYVTKEVPLRECTQVNGEWVWNGAQSIKCDDNGNGYSVELIQKNLEFNAAGLGVTEAAKWKSYDAAMVKVKVPQTITEVGQDPNQIMYRIVTDKDGRTWVIVPCPPYNKPPRGGYYKKGYPQKYWNKYHKDKFKKNKRFYTTRGYVNTNQKPMKIDYSNVRTYSKQHFLQQQGLGYKYWAQWGDGRIENHRNRYGRKVAPSTYRNPRAKQRSLYKDLYAKYGASRMNMRQNIAGYSNASVTRLRRNEIANRTYNLRMRNKI